MSSSRMVSPFPLRFLFLFLFSLSCVCFCVCDDSNPFAPDSNIVDLGDDTFSEFLSANGVALVEFYAPWCGHCKSLAPTYHELAEKVVEEGLNIKIARVNCEDNPKVASELSIQGYPTLKIFHDGVPQDYAGERTLEALYAAAKEHSKKDWEAPSDYTQWLNEQNFHDSLASVPLSLVSFTSTSSDCVLCKGSNEDLVKASRVLHKASSKSSTPVQIFLFDCSISSSFCSSFNVTPPTHFLYRQQRRVSYSGPKYNADNIAKFLQEEAATSASRLLTSRKSVESFLAPKVSAIAFFSTDISSDEQLRTTPTGVSWLLFVAKNRGDEGYQFAHVYGGEWLDTVQGGLKKSDLPAFCVTQPKKYHKSKEGDFKTQCRSLKVGNEELTGTHKESHDVLTTFLEAHRLPVVPSYSWSQDSWFSRPLFLLFLDASYADPSTAKEAQYWRSRLFALSKRFSSASPSLRFAIASLEESSILQRLNLQCNDAVCAGIVTKDNGPQDDPHGLRGKLKLKNPDDSYFRLDRFPLSEDDYEATSKGIEQFVDDFLKGTVQPLVKSAASPSVDLKKSSIAFPLTARTIFDVLLRSAPTKDKDFVILFYTSEKGCAPCESAKERLETLALQLKTDKQTDIVVALYDMAVNDVPVVYENRNTIPFAFFVSAEERLKPVTMPLPGYRISADVMMDQFMEFLGAHSKKIKVPHKPKEEL